MPCVYKFVSFLVLKLYSYLTGDFEIVKLCDFGVSVPLKGNGQMDTDVGLEYVGTGPWCAPEVLCNDGLTPITAKTDIFSFGLILWEMITLRTPHIDESLIEEVEESGSTVTDLSYGKFGLHEEVCLCLIMYTLLRLIFIYVTFKTLVCISQKTHYF